MATWVITDIASDRRWAQSSELIHSLHPHIAVGTIKVYNCVVCKCGWITLFSVQISCHLLTRCIISPTGHKNISLLDKFHAGYIGCIVTCHVKCRLLACCILSGLDAHCVLLHRAASAQMTKYSPLVDICICVPFYWHHGINFNTGFRKNCERYKTETFLADPNALMAFKSVWKNRKLAKE